MPFWPTFGEPSSSHHHHSSSGRHNSDHHSPSSRSWFRPSYARSSSSWTKGSSYYRRRSRDGYVERLVQKFKHLLRELWYYLRRNPVKVFFLVIMPLISGGALAAVATQFGVKLPAFLNGRGARDISSAFGGRDDHFSRSGPDGGFNAESLGSLMNIAKMFL